MLEFIHFPILQTARRNIFGLETQFRTEIGTYHELNTDANKHI